MKEIIFRKNLLNDTVDKITIDTYLKETEDDPSTRVYDRMHILLEGSFYEWEDFRYSLSEQDLKEE